MTSATISVPTTGTDPKSAELDDLETTVNTALEENYDYANMMASQRATVRPVNPFRDFIEVRLEDGVIRFPNMKFYVNGETQVNISPVTVADQYTELTFPTAFATDVFYYADLDVPEITTGVDIRALSDNRKVVIGWANAGVFHNPHGFPVIYADPSPEKMAAVAGQGEMRIEAVCREVAGVPFPDERFGLAPFFHTSTKYVIANEVIQPNEFQTRASGAKVDLSYIEDGIWNDIVLKGTATIYAGHGRTFFGSANNLATFASSPTFCRAKWVDMGGGAAGVVLEVIAGSAPTYSTISDPVHETSIITGGQSQKEGGLRYGLAGGFSRGTRNATWMETALDLDLRYVDGATGGSAVDSRSSGSNYWWDASGPSDGPAMTTWKAAVDAAIAEGQPVPECIDWAQGEADAPALQAGLLTVSQLNASIQAVFAEMRTYLLGKGASNPQIIVMMPGSDESTVRQGMVGVHWAYQTAITNLSYAHLGIEMYDLPRPYDDVHLNQLGRYTVGYRNARAYGNIMLGQANDLGPEVLTAVRDGTRTAVLTFSASAVMPKGDINDTTARGPYPFGLGAIPAGFTGSQAMIPLAGGRVVGSTIELYSHTSLSGARICRAGHDAGARMAQHVRSDDLHVKSLGMPLRTFVTSALT